MAGGEFNNKVPPELSGAGMPTGGIIQPPVHGVTERGAQPQGNLPGVLPKDSTRDTSPPLQQRGVVAKDSQEHRIPDRSVQVTGAAAQPAEEQDKQQDGHVDLTHSVLEGAVQEDVDIVVSNVDEPTHVPAVSPVLVGSRSGMVFSRERTQASDGKQRELQTAAVRQDERDDLIDAFLYADTYDKMTGYLEENGVTPGADDYEVVKLRARNAEYKWLSFKYGSAGSSVSEEESARIKEGMEATDGLLTKLYIHNREQFDRTGRMHAFIESTYETAVEQIKTGRSESQSIDTQIKAAELLNTHLAFLEGRGKPDIQPLVAVHQENPREVMRKSLSEILSNEGIARDSEIYEIIGVLARDAENKEKLADWERRNGQVAVDLPVSARRHYWPVTDLLAKVAGSTDDLHYLETNPQYEQATKTFGILRGAYENVLRDGYMRFMGGQPLSMDIRFKTTQFLRADLFDGALNRYLPERSEGPEDPFAIERARVRAFLQFTDPQSDKVQLLRALALESVSVQSQVLDEYNGLPGSNTFMLQQARLVQEELRRTLGEEKFLMVQEFFYKGLVVDYLRATRKAKGFDPDFEASGVYDKSEKRVAVTALFEDLEAVIAQRQEEWQERSTARSEPERILRFYMQGEWVPNRMRLEALQSIVKKEKAVNQTRRIVKAHDLGRINEKRAKRIIGKGQKRAARVRERENRKFEEKWRDWVGDLDFYEVKWMSDDVYQAYLTDATNAVLYPPSGYEYAIIMLKDELLSYKTNQVVIDIAGIGRQFPSI